MDDDYLLATVRYVDMNPVKARLCDRPQDWGWSSARAHFAGEDDVLVQVRLMLERVYDWRSYLAGVNPRTDALVAQHSRTGRPLGTDAFVSGLEAITSATLQPGRLGRKPKGEKE